MITTTTTMTTQGWFDEEVDERRIVGTHFLCCVSPSSSSSSFRQGWNCWWWQIHGYVKKCARTPPAPHRRIPGLGRRNVGRYMPSVGMLERVLQKYLRALKFMFYLSLLSSSSSLVVDPLKERAAMRFPEDLRHWSEWNAFTDMLPSCSWRKI